MFHLCLSVVNPVRNGRARKTKDRFVLIDAVGIVESELADPQTLERKRSALLKQLLEAVAAGVTDEDTLSSLAGRLVRLAKVWGRQSRLRLKKEAADCRWETYPIACWMPSTQIKFKRAIRKS